MYTQGCVYMGVYVYIKLGYGVTETQSYQRVSKFYKYRERKLGKR